MSTTHFARNQYYGLDIAKLFMAIVVVAIHTQPLIDCSNMILVNISELFFKSAVPFFFLCSGFFLGKKICGKNKIEKLAQTKKYMKRIANMYVVWTVVYLPLAIYGFYLNHYSIIKSLIYYVRGFLVVGEQYNSWILWYLLSMIYALLILYVLVKYNCSIRTIILIAFMVYGFGYVVEYIYQYNGGNVVLNRIGEIFLRLGLTKRIFSGLFFLSLGVLFSEKKMNNSFSAVFLLLGLLLFMVPFIRPIGVIIFSIAFFAICKKWTGKNNAFCILCRRMSMVVYFVHLWLWTVIYLIVYGEKKFGVEIFCLTAVLSLVVSVLYVLVVSRFFAKKIAKRWVADTTIP